MCMDRLQLHRNERRWHLSEKCHGVQRRFHRRWASSEDGSGTATCVCRHEGRQVISRCFDGFMRRADATGGGMVAMRFQGLLGDCGRWQTLSQPSRPRGGVGVTTHHHLFSQHVPLQHNKIPCSQTVSKFCRAPYTSRMNRSTLFSHFSVFLRFLRFLEGVITFFLVFFWLGFEWVLGILGFHFFKVFQVVSFLRASNFFFLFLSFFCFDDFTLLACFSGN